MSDDQLELCKKVQTLAVELLNDGAAPSDVSFALGWVATDLGLEVTEGSIAVFPVLLAAVTDAISKSLSSGKDGDGGKEAGDNEASDDLSGQVPVGAVIH